MAARRKPTSVTAAIAQGRLPTLMALRDVLASKLDTADLSPAQVTAFAKELRETLGEIAELEKSQPKGSVVDELQGRRKSRGRAATSQRAAQGGSPKRRS